MTATARADDSDEIAIGAAAIAHRCFADAITDRQVYRLAEENSGWPFFRLRGKLAMRPAAARAEVQRRETPGYKPGRAP